MYSFIAQTAPTEFNLEDTLGLNLLNQAIDVTRNTAASWNRLWTEFINPNGEIWAGLCRFAMTLAAASIILVSLKMLWEHHKGGFSWSDLAASFIWPLVIVFFLGNNGSLLSSTVVIVRSIASQQVTAILEFQVTDLTFRQALTNVTLSINAKQQILAIYTECQGKSAEERTTCLQEKLPTVERIVEEAERLNGGTIAELQQLLNDLRNTILNPLSTITAATASVPVAFLMALQWAFVNILEAALIMTAAFAPIAMGLSFLPIGTKPIWAWASGFLSLFGIQLGYNIVIGLVATVIVAANAQSITDLAFVAFISIFAPMLAVAIAGGGGIALYSSISQGVTTTVTTAVSAAGAIAGGAVGGLPGAVAGANAGSAVASTATGSIGAASASNQYSTIE